MVSALLLTRVVSHQLRPFLVSFNHEDLVALKELTESEKATPVIDRTYPLSETPKAITHVAGGHTQGKVVITI